jgi:hypothetical protein
LSDDPFGSEYIPGDYTLFTIEIPEDFICEFEWVEGGYYFKFLESHPYVWRGVGVQEGKWIREFLAPASLLNSYGPPVVVDQRRENHIGLNQLMEANKGKRFAFWEDSEGFGVAKEWATAIANFIVTLSRVRFYIKKDWSLPWETPNSRSLIFPI